MSKIFDINVVESKLWKNKFVQKVLNLMRIRIVGFSMVGGSVFVMGIGILALQVEVLHINQILAGFINMVISVEVNFVLNKYLNWRDRPGDFWSQWLKFHASRIVTIIINQLLYTFLVELGFNYLLVTMGLTLLVTVANYFGSDKFAFVFKKGKHNEQEI